MKRVASVVCTAALVLAEGGASAQPGFSGGVNVDFNVSSGPGSGQPAIVFGGAVGQGGFWNAVNGPLANGGAGVILRNLANNADAVTLTYTAPGGPSNVAMFGFNNPVSLGDGELLLDDGADLGTDSAVDHWFAVSAFAPGFYRVVTYAIGPDSEPARTGVRVVTHQMTTAEQQVGGAMPAGGALVPGVTHAVHDVSLLIESQIRVQARPVAGFGTVGGIQVQRLNPTRLYVRSGAGSSGSGLSWESAFGDLQIALAMARVTPSVTEVWVAGGTYPVDGYPETAGDRNAEFLIRPGLSVYGGFAGTEATVAERTLNNPASETILSGGGFAYHTVVAQGAGAARIDGVTITGGFNDLPFEMWGQFSGGSAVLVRDGAQVSMDNCTVRGNSSQGFGTLTVWGSGSSLTLERSVVRENAALFGSAIDLGNSAVATVRRSALVNNTGAGSGGLLEIGNDSSLTMSDSLIANNTVELNLMDASFAVRTDFFNCTVAFNRSTGEYVRLYLAEGSQVRNCIFWGNVISTGLAGQYGPQGVLDRAEWMSGRVTDCTIQGWDGTLAAPILGNNGRDPRFVGGLPAGSGHSAGGVSPLLYTLGSRSPARDSGYNPDAAGPMDFFGNARIVDDPFFPNTGFDGGVIDRGFAEAQTPSNVCPGDIGQTGGVPGPDGLRDNNDFVVFIDWFFFLDARADIGQSGGVPGADGLFDNNDFIVFIDRFFVACP